MDDPCAPLPCRHLIEEIFDELDDDASGKVGFDELHAWFKGRDTVYLRRKRIIQGVTLASRVSEADEPWTTKRLRSELIEALQHVKARPIDLFELWDTDRSRWLRKKEWLVQWKRLVGVPKHVPEPVYYDVVRTAVRRPTVVFDPSSPI